MAKKENPNIKKIIESYTSGGKEAVEKLMRDVEFTKHTPMIIIDGLHRCEFLNPMSISNRVFVLTTPILDQVHSGT